MDAFIAGVVLAPLVLGVYAYLVYPVLLWIVSQSRSRPGRMDVTEPSVTVVLAAYNEEMQIAGAIEALLRQDYPAARRQILIVSDASTDGTDAIVQSYAARGVELLRMSTRVGKTAAENAALGHIRGEIVVNTDASIRFHEQALRKLVHALDDPEVGVASARNVSVARAAGANRAEAGYVGYDMAIRLFETRAGGIVGASGAGYAIRKTLHVLPVRNDLSRDFSAAMTAQRHGFRSVFVDDAICYVPRAFSLRREYLRKVRTISRGMETLYHNRDLLNPLTTGTFAWKLFSHKIARWAVPVAAMPSLIGIVYFALRYPVAWIVAALGLVAAAAALIGATWPEHRRPTRWIPTGIVGALAANLAVVHSAWRFLRRHHDHVWEPTRRVAPAP
jgi:cellulose synthase/poly-beta-1,6-N-acetylglucosamine synthase-like glycosyltransferase